MFNTDKYLELLKQYPPRLYGVELLKFLLELKNLQKQDLLSIFENQSTLDDVFDGQQELTDIHIQKLADFF